MLLVCCPFPLFCSCCGWHCRSETRTHICSFSFTVMEVTLDPSLHLQSFFSPLWKSHLTHHSICNHATYNDTHTHMFNSPLTFGIPINEYEVTLVMLLCCLHEFKYLHMYVYSAFSLLPELDQGPVSVKDLWARVPWKPLEFYNDLIECFARVSHCCEMWLSAYLWDHHA